MTVLLDAAPYSARDDKTLLTEAVELSRWHLNGCADYSRIWPSFSDAQSFDQLPWLHVGLFKRIHFKTIHESLKHQRVLLSSATSSGTSSQVALDDRSGQLQARSSLSILQDFIGSIRRPLIVLDEASSLRARGQVSARVAAALSLLPLASQSSFVLKPSDGGLAVDYKQVSEAIAKAESLLVYGFTWALWKYWAAADFPDEVATTLKTRVIHFVHSGGWKKLEHEAVSREQFESTLLEQVAPQSRVIDFYGLVEQNGIIFPECENRSRHVPRWAAVLVRDPLTMRSLPANETGMLQFINVLAQGAPYHSVLTEDLGYLQEGLCSCGRQGPRFVLVGRIPKAEVRGCANV